MIVCADYYVYRYVFKAFYHKMCGQVCMQRIMCVEYSIWRCCTLRGSSVPHVAEIANLKLIQVSYCCIELQSHNYAVTLRACVHVYGCQRRQIALIHGIV